MNRALVVNVTGGRIQNLGETQIPSPWNGEGTYVQLKTSSKKQAYLDH